MRFDIASIDSSKHFLSGEHGHWLIEAEILIEAANLKQKDVFSQLHTKHRILTQTTK